MIEVDFMDFKRVMGCLTGASVLLLAIATGGQADEKAAEQKITQAAVEARAEADLSSWRKRLPVARPRLFSESMARQALRARFEAAKGRERELFDQVMEQANKIVTTPVTAYRTPEEDVKRKQDSNYTLFAAREELWQRQVGDAIVELSFALALQDNAAMRTKLHEMVLTVCGYPHWGAAPLNGDLASAHVSRAIAIAYDWHSDFWNNEDKALIRKTIRERVSDLTKDIYDPHYWGSAYQCNHNHVNAAAIGLCGVAFLDEIPEASKWIAAALVDFDHVMACVNADGSTSEGVPYWTYSLSFLLQFIEATRHVLGTDSMYRSSFFHHAIPYRLYSSTPGFGGVLAYGDSALRDFYGPQHILYRLASEYHDSGGQYLATNIPFAPQGNADIIAWTALWYDPSIPEQSPSQGDHHFADLDIATTRSGWGKKDYLLSVKSGFINRNHGHLDAGALLWSFGDTWLLVAPGYGQGSGNPEFWQRSGPRWTFLSNSTEAESTLLINGKNQSYTDKTRGTINEFVTGANWCWTGVDLSDVYEDADHVKREILHRRGDYALVLDQITASSNVTVEWLAQVPVSAVASGNVAQINEMVGSLELRALAPSTVKFVERKPTSPHIDLPENRLKTLSLLAKGEIVNFAVALIPTFSGSKPSVENLVCEQIPEGRLFTIKGAAWQDKVLISRTDSTAILAATDQSKKTSFDPAVMTSIQIHAHASAIRFTDKKVESILAIGVRSIAGAGIHLNFDEPSYLTLQRISARAWLIDLARPARMTLPQGKKWKFINLISSESVTTEKVLPDGQYGLVADDSEIEALHLWIKNSKDMR